MREGEKKIQYGYVFFFFFFYYIGVGGSVGWEGIDMIFSRGVCVAPLLSGCLALVSEGVIVNTFTSPLFLLVREP